MTTTNQDMTTDTHLVHWFDHRHNAIICATSWCQARGRDHRTLWDRDPERVTCPDCRERARAASAEGLAALPPAAIEREATP
jgi:hypothetical protein